MVRTLTVVAALAAGLCLLQLASARISYDAIGNQVRVCSRDIESTMSTNPRETCGRDVPDQLKSSKNPLKDAPAVLTTCLHNNFASRYVDEASKCLKKAIAVGVCC